MFRPTHRHKKRGTVYIHMGSARIQTSTPLKDMDEVEIYIAEDGSIWARKKDEFYDGRFERIKYAD